MKVKLHMKLSPIKVIGGAVVVGFGAQAILAVIMEEYVFAGCCIGVGIGWVWRIDNF